MAIIRSNISDFLVQCRNKPLFDVRSPGEYQHAHIPGAISLPLFSDAERKEVGTAYKQQSRETAIKIGLDFFGPKMRTMVETVEAAAGDDKSIFVYCWRGGMRSGAVSWLLDLYGFKVTVLAGGYKAFRNFALKSFEESYTFKVLGGYTGSGKTEVLKTLELAGETVIDLEGIASHKGSAFGKFGMPKQPGQEMFENKLCLALMEAASRSKKQTAPIWVEDESQRIGDINLPKTVWERLREAPVVFLDIPFEERLARIEAEYGGISAEHLKDSIIRISKRLGPQNATAAIQFLEEGNAKEAFRILLHYYDKRYLKGLHNRANLENLLTRLPCEKVSMHNAQQLIKHPAL